MLLNKNFLLQLDQQQNTEKYARITLLTNKELPIEQIEGRITSGGSISIDGNSAIRRTCSLTMVSQDTNYHAHYWTLKSKFKLEIGIRNNINPVYPDIIWFPQGIYIFTSFSTSHSVNNFTISLQGKDKGCLINGEINGNFNSSVDLGTIEEIDEEGNSTITKLNLKDIIINMMHQYAGEPFKNIIVNDLDETGFELLEYRGNEDLFLWKEEDAQNYKNMFFTKTAPDFYLDENETSKVDFEIQEEGFDILINTFENQGEPFVFYREGKSYNIAKIKYGQTAGYKVTNLVYAGDLIASVGDSIASILDKIKNMLGQYEYFYDIEGRFIFQKKRYYVNSPIGREGNEGEDLPQQEEIAYTLTGMKTASSFSNNPNLSNLKNDFSIWGERKSEADIAIPIHLRYAIDEKPAEYTSIKVEDSEVKAYNEKYKANLTGQNEIKYTIGDVYSVDNPEAPKEIICNWREIIYQMALDHFKYGFLDNFELKVISANKGLYPTGMTGYEQYYIDILSFWRDLYFPEIFAYDTELKNEEVNLKISQDNKNNIQEQIDTWNNRIKYLENRNKELAKIISKSRLNTPAFIIRENRLDVPNFSIQELLLDLPNFQIVSSKALTTPNMKIIKGKIKVSKPSFSITEMNTDENGKFLLSVPSNWRIEEVLNVKEAQMEFSMNLEEIQRIYTEEFEDIKNENGEVQKKGLKTLLKEYTAEIDTHKKNIQKIKVKMENREAEDYYDDNTSENYCWNKKKDLSPELLNFWFDFLDNESSVTNYGVQKIGVRAKPVNDNKINSIYFRKTPDVIFVENIEESEHIQGYKYLQINGLDTLFTIRAQGRSAKDELDTLLYNHLFTADNISISTKPIYYLEPNTKIRIVDEDTNTSGDYIITRLSLPLTYNGTMSITANRAVKNIL